MKNKKVNLHETIPRLEEYQNTLKIHSKHLLYVLFKTVDKYVIQYFCGQFRLIEKTNSSSIK